MNNGSADHSACMGEYQDNDLSYGQLDHSVGIFQFVVVALEEEKDLKQLKVNYHKEIHNSEIGWD